MNKLRLTYLFRAYFNKTATSNERNELIELLGQSENDEQVKILLRETWQQFNSQSQLFTDSRGEEMLANILQKGRGSNPVVVAYKHLFSWLRITAAAAILFFAVIGVDFWLNSKQPMQPIAQSKKNPENAIVPGGNKAVLTLADGSRIVLDSIHGGALANQGNVKVMKLNAATVAYNAGSAASKEIVYNTLSTPSGGQYHLILPDGTQVWLNASSSIHFPTMFKGKERNVTVTGEVYFEVANMPAKEGYGKIPFVVKIDTPSGEGGEVKVFGTHFNIMAYHNESFMHTTLLEGSVKVSKGSLSEMLVPGQQSRINRTTGGIKVVEANLEEVMAWKNGWFQFNACDIEQVMRQISRWYDVEIVYEGNIPPGHFSGLVSRRNDISQVLKIMQAGGVRFRIEGRKVIVLS